MKRVYVLTPLIAMAAFFVYYASWSTADVYRPSRRESTRDPYVGRDGAREAQATLARGKLVYLEYGLPVVWQTERREIARQKFGVECRPIAGCIVTEALVTFAAAYNQVMEAAIVSRFGSDVFDTINREGQALLEARASQKTG